MKKHLLLLLLLIGPQALADDSVSSLIRILENPLTPSTSLQCEDDDTSDLNACAISLCGPAISAPVAVVNDANFDFYVKSGSQEKYPEIQELSGKYYDNKMQEVNDFIEQFRKTFGDSNPKLELSDWKDGYDILASSFYSNFFYMDTDTSKPLKERISIVYQMPDDVSPVEKKAIEEYAEGQKKHQEEDVQIGIYNNLYTLDESKELVGKAWKSFFDKYNEKFKANPEFMKYELETIKKYQDPKSLEVDDSSSLGQIYGDINFLERAFNTEMGTPVPDVVPKTFCQETCQKGLSERLQKLNPQKIVSDLEKAKGDLSKDDLFANCKADLTQKSLKDSNNKEFLDEYPAIKENFVSRAMARYSDHSKNAFKKYLDEELHASFVQYDANVDEFMKNLKDMADQEPASIPTDKKGFIEGLTRYLDSGTSKVSLKMYICGGDTVFAAWDAYAPKGPGNSGGDADPLKDNMFVSYYSCSHPVEAKGIISHEMGHALSDAMKKNKLSELSKKEFLKTRQCVTDSYIMPINEKNSFLEFEGDSLRTEEDNADVISFHSEDPHSPLFTCALLETTEDGLTYKNLQLKNSVEQDSHSSPMLRVLREAIYKNYKLTKTCQSIVNKNKDKYRFSVCQ